MTGAVDAQTTPGNAPTEARLDVTSLSAPDSAAPNGTVAVSVTVENPGATETTVPASLSGLVALVPGPF